MSRWYKAAQWGKSEYVAGVDNIMQGGNAGGIKASFLMGYLL